MRGSAAWREEEAAGREKCLPCPLPMGGLLKFSKSITTVVLSPVPVSEGGRYSKNVKGSLGRV